MSPKKPKGLRFHQVVWLVLCLMSWCHARDICTQSAVLTEEGLIKRAVPKSFPISADLTSHMEVVDTLGKAFIFEPIGIKNDWAHGCHLLNSAELIMHF